MAETGRGSKLALVPFLSPAAPATFPDPMKISMEWLSQYLPGPLEAGKAAEALTHGGLPVEVIEAVGDDTVIDVEVTSNRGDCLSHLGVARELSALLDRTWQAPEAKINETSEPASGATSVSIEAANLCPHYTARIIRNVKIGPSPEWMVRRLEAVGLRSINNVVDITNYVMFEMGQPLHAFDFDKLQGRKIIVREAKKGEKITSIDGRERELSAGMLVIADASRPVALAGVMGGLDSEVSNSTTHVLLESARFDPLSVRKTARALAMGSDSSYRFERQIDPTLPERASLRAAQLIAELAGGEVLQGVVAAGSSNYTAKSLSLRFSKLRQVLGVDLPKDQVIHALRRDHMNPVDRGDKVEVTVPPWRLDLNIEVDLVEEVARIVGYEKIPTREQIEIRVTPPQPENITINLIREALVASGYFEAITVSFAPDLLAGDFTPPTAASLIRADMSVRKDNARLRPSIVPGLLEVLRRNESAGMAAIRLFELGSSFWFDQAGKVQEHRRVTLLANTDYRELRGAVEVLLNKLNSEREVKILPADFPGFAKGACGQIQWGNEVLGQIGRIDRKIAQKLSLRELPCAAELDLQTLLGGAQHIPQLRGLPKFPAVERDLSLVVREKTRYEEIQSLVRDLGLPNLESLEYVTTYRGKPLEKGSKSISIRLVFRSPETTLTSEQVESSIQKVIEAAQSNLKATLRT